MLQPGTPPVARWALWLCVLLVLTKMGHGQPWPVGFATLQGRRLQMEDHTDVLLGRCSGALDGKPHLLAGVFDGHSGSWVAEWLANRLLKDVHSRLCSQYGLVAAAASDGQAAHAQPQLGPAALQATLLAAFQAADVGVLQQQASGLPDAGSTAVVAALLEVADSDNSAANPAKALFTASVGNSRAVVCRGPAPPPEMRSSSSSSSSWLERRRRMKDQPPPTWMPYVLTPLHEASNATEAARVAQAGGVVVTQGDDMPRLQGELELTRAFGDAMYRRQGLNAQPELSTYYMAPDDQVLVLASDGVFEVLSPQAVCDHAAAELEGLSNPQRSPPPAPPIALGAVPDDAAGPDLTAIVQAPPGAASIQASARLHVCSDSVCTEEEPRGGDALEDTGQEAAQLGTQCHCGALPLLQGVSQRLVDEAHARGSGDNLAVVAVGLQRRHGCWRHNDPATHVPPATPFQLHQPTGQLQEQPGSLQAALGQSTHLHHCRVLRQHCVAPYWVDGASSLLHRLVRRLLCVLQWLAAVSGYTPRWGPLACTCSTGDGDNRCPAGGSCMVASCNSDDADATITAGSILACHVEGAASGAATCATEEDSGDATDGGEYQLTGLLLQMPRSPAQRHTHWHHALRLAGMELPASGRLGLPGMVREGDSQPVSTPDDEEKEVVSLQPEDLDTEHFRPERLGLPDYASGCLARNDSGCDPGGLAALQDLVQGAMDPGAGLPALNDTDGAQHGDLPQPTSASEALAELAPPAAPGFGDLSLGVGRGIGRTLLTARLDLDDMATQPNSDSVPGDSVHESDSQAGPAAVHDPLKPNIVAAAIERMVLERTSGEGSSGDGGKYHLDRRCGGGHFGEVWRGVRRPVGAAAAQHIRGGGVGDHGDGDAQPGPAAGGEQLVLKRVFAERGAAYWRAGLREAYLGQLLLQASLPRTDKPPHPGLSHLVQFVEAFETGGGSGRGHVGAPGVPGAGSLSQEPRAGLPPQAPSPRSDLWLVFKHAGASLHDLMYEPFQPGGQEGDTAPPPEPDAHGFQLLGPSRWWWGLRRASHDARGPMREVLRQLLLGLAALQELNITHRDIKPDNMMLDRPGSAGDGVPPLRAAGPFTWTGREVLRIIDLGSALDEVSLSSGMWGRAGPGAGTTTAEYAPPEALFARLWEGMTTTVRPRMWAYDMWSVGVVWLEMLLGTPDVWALPAPVRARLDLQLSAAKRPTIDRASAYLLRGLMQWCISPPLRAPPAEKAPGATQGDGAQAGQQGGPGAPVIPWECTDGALLELLRARDPTGLGLGSNKSALRLLLSLLSWSPERRPSAAQALQHDYFIA